MGNNETVRQSSAPSGRRIRLNAFDANCVGNQLPGIWRHPRDHSREYKDLRHWTEMARLLERGLFDSLFIADALGPCDVYGGNADAAVRTAAKVPINDPMMLVSAMAAVTEHLGFGITSCTASEHPYPFARRMSTLDHLTGGRVGWNVVTGYLRSAANNMGQSDQLPHDERYDRADEYMEVLYKLWEGSWEDDAVVMDADRDMFADPAKVHPINHHGRYFDVPGFHLCEPSPQRTPVIFQAGASPRGIRFAARHAEAMFVSAPTRARLARTVKDMRDALQAEGRGRYDARIYARMMGVADETDELAQAKYRDYFRFVSDTGNLVLNSAWSGVDMSREDLDRPLDPVTTNAIQATVSSLSGAAGPDGERWTLRDSARIYATGGPVVVGSGETVADAMQQFVAETDVDGFNLAYVVEPSSWEDVIDYVIPVLQRRGVYPTSYEGTSLRDGLFGRGDRLPDSHIGARYRHLG